ncbi:MAG: L-threonylcarbamoyladenylate synthase [Ilumatobacteraceae bacterium]
MTLLVGRSAAVPDGITGGRSTVAIRVPAHPLALGIIERLGRAVVAPSANRFGRVSPTTPRHVLDELGDALDPSRDLVVDGGATTVGIESTIVDCTTPLPQVLRPGAITAEDIERIVGDIAAGERSGACAWHVGAALLPAAAVEVFEDREAAERRRAQLTDGRCGRRRARRRRSRRVRQRPLPVVASGRRRRRGSRPRRPAVTARDRHRRPRPPAQSVSQALTLRR